MNRVHVFLRQRMISKIISDSKKSGFTKIEGKTKEEKKKNFMLSLGLSENGEFKKEDQ